MKSCRECDGGIRVYYYPKGRFRGQYLLKHGPQGLSVEIMPGNGLRWAPDTMQDCSRVDRHLLELGPIMADTESLLQRACPRASAL